LRLHDAAARTRQPHFQLQRVDRDAAAGEGWLDRGSGAGEARPEQPRAARRVDLCAQYQMGDARRVRNLLQHLRSHWQRGSVVAEPAFLDQQPQRTGDGGLRAALPAEERLTDRLSGSDEDYGVELSRSRVYYLEQLGVLSLR